MDRVSWQIGRRAVVVVGLAQVLANPTSCNPVTCEENPSFFRFGFWSRFPRRLRRNDPVWSLTARQQRQRAKDETKQQEILKEIHSLTANRNSMSKAELPKLQERLAVLQRRWLDTVYGRGVGLPERQAFLEKFGCTGYNEKVLDEIVSIGKEHGGIVEIGAGNGQWARAITDHFHKQQSSSRRFQMVLAYDNGSALPLHPSVYHAKTQPAHKYFYPHVQPLLSDNTSIEHTLQQWSCRGRALLLVYPAPGNDMAARAVQAYSRLPQKVHTVVYVGEGRGGANAEESFFRYMEEDGGWILCKVLDVESFGSKGYEKMYVLRKETDSNTQEDTATVLR